MCLAIPMKITRIDANCGVAQAGGVSRSVNLQLLDDVNVGDYVIVHAGFAIQRLDEKEAKETLDLLKEL